MGEAGLEPVFIRTGVIGRMSAGIGHVKVNRFIIKDVYALNKICQSLYLVSKLIFKTKWPNVSIEQLKSTQSAIFIVHELVCKLKIVYLKEA